MPCIPTYPQLRRKNLIDPVSNIKDSRVYLFSGKIDSVVHTGVVKHAEDFYNNYDAKVTTEYSLNAQHTWPTVSNGKNCQILGKPYIGACKFDGAFESLKVILPDGSSLKPPVSANSGSLSEFSQTPYTGIGYSMQKNGYIYVPKACADG